MLKSNIKAITFLILFAMLVLFNTVCEAQTTAGDKIIITIRAKGNKAISDATILSKTKTKPGSRFSQEIVNDDIKRLYALGYFTDVAVDVEDYEEGVMVTIVVEEKPVIKEILFEGNEKMSAKRLKKTMKLKEGDMLSFSTLSEDISEVRTFYERNGFHQVNVRYELEKDEELNQVKVKIVVSEKGRVRVKRVYIEGNKSVKTSKIKQLMETRPAWLLRRGYFDDETFENDIMRIKAYYQDMGFLDVIITPELNYDKEKGVMYITLNPF